MILTDTKVAHGAMPDGETLHYSSPSGLQHFHREEVLFDLSCRQRQLPKTLNSGTTTTNPITELAGDAEVFPVAGARGVPVRGALPQPAAAALAAVRAEELRCRRERQWSSTVPYLRPGYTFKMPGSSLLAPISTDVIDDGPDARGEPGGVPAGGLGGELTAGEREPYYRNTFEAVPAAVYRPARVTAKARLYGTLNAKVDGAGSGQYAELDGQGRYKVVLPFDVSGRKDGKASAWVRMMQPYAGAGHGMHFPLHKGDGRCC